MYYDFDFVYIPHFIDEHFHLTIFPIFPMQRWL